MRVGILGLSHESNSFLDRPTTWEDFEHGGINQGQAIRERLGSSHHEIAGFLEGLAAYDIEAVPIFHARAVPSGVITAQTCEALMERMFKALDEAGPLDGVLASPHGAAVASHQPDMDGYWLGQLRRRMGPDRPIIASLDPHANVSRQMVEATDALIAYRTNPHLDQRERGREAATLIARTLAGQVKPVQGLAPPRMAINIERQLTTASPTRDLLDVADEQKQRPGILTNSVILGFPYADVAEMGSSFVVVADNDQALAQQSAEELSDWLWAHREQFVGVMIEPKEALRQAMQALEEDGPDEDSRGDGGRGPVCLLDMGDNVGGGSPADGTWLAHELHEAQIADALVCLYDPEAAAAAREVGLGNSAQLTMGGKTDNRHGSPLKATVTVQSLHDGHFTETQPRHGGSTYFNMGPSAVVRTEHGLVLLLNSHRTPPFSLNQVTTCGIDLNSLRIVVAKAVHSAVAAYGPYCRKLIRVNTPGITTADMESLTYQNRSRPLFPFERS